MTARDFAYWLQGLFELSDTKTLNEKQTEAIKSHLAMVFLHEIDPGNVKDLDPEIRKLIEDVHNRRGGSSGDTRLMC